MRDVSMQTGEATVLVRHLWPESMTTRESNYDTPARPWEDMGSTGWPENRSGPTHQRALKMLSKTSLTNRSIGQRVLRLRRVNMLLE